MTFHINGDGSYLGVVDTQTYYGFVGPDWANNAKLLEPHFIEQMQRYSGLFWNTNLESNWVIDVNTVVGSSSGFREVTGSIQVTGGKLAILEYNSLSMLAQFKDRSLEKYVKNNFITLENGNYQVKIIQKFDPLTHFSDGISPDFMLEIVAAESLLPPWQIVPWSTL